MENLNFNELRKMVNKHHRYANCHYGDNNDNYMIHVDSVANTMVLFSKIYKKSEDYYLSLAACYYHDTIEDARLTFNDVKIETNEEIARIVLAVSDVPEETRLLRHLLTMSKTIKDYRAIIVKMCDMYANANYSKLTGSSMYEKYYNEYRYRRPIFKLALKQYLINFNEDILNGFWIILDNIHDFNE